ncbi:MAG: MG2 domain-containing protein [Alloprevotella sp.]
MWQHVESAVAADQPKTALNHLRQIRQKAENEQNMSWKLKALLTEVRLQGDIAPDSAKAALSRLETVRQRVGNPLHKAIISATMARLYGGRYDTASVALVRRLTLEAMGQAKPLAEAQSRDYLPLLKRGEDSRYFGHDMLSVVVKEALATGSMSLDTKTEIVGRAIDVYRQIGRRQAVLLLTLDSIALTGPRAPSFAQSTDIAALKRLAQEMGDTEPGVEIYIALTEATDYVVDEADVRAVDSIKIAWAEEGLSRFGKTKRAAVLRNFIASQTRPSLSLHLDCRTLYPGESYRAAIRHQNVEQWRVRFYRLEGITAADPRLADEKQWAKLPRREDKKAAVSMTAKADIPPYVTTTDSLDLCLTEPGIYYVVLEADGKTLDGQLVYVSRMMPLTLSVAGEPSRVCLVDRQTGNLLEGATITAYRRDAGRQWQIGRYKPDGQGEITISATRADISQNLFFAETAADHFYPSFSLYPAGRHYAAGDTQTHRRVNLFTDRAIYRPGQEVLFGGFAHSQRGDDVAVIAGLELTVTLTDANGEHVADTTLRSDEWGSFGGRFVLPQITLPGQFTLSTSAGGSAALSVEEYKRPTFSVTIQAPADGAQLGQELTLTGVAETYTGLPVSGATVAYTVKEQSYWRRGGYTAESTDVSGATTTDSLGRFAIPLSLVSRTQPLADVGHLQFLITADVTASNGETQTATHHLWASHRPSWLSASWPSTLCKEQLPQVTVEHTANTGLPISSQAHLTISCNGRTLWADTITTGRPFVPTALAALPSGGYDLTLTVSGADTLRRRFTLFSSADTRPADKSAAWWFNEQKNATADSATVVVGTALKDATLFIDRFDSRGRVSHKAIALSDTILRFNLTYRPEVGEGERVVFTMVRDGQIHTDQSTVTKPLPQKKLNLSWHTFRDRLSPGSHETWQLRVTHPDGRPAAASVLARLYDASLDALAGSPWNFSLSFSRPMPFSHYNKPYAGRFSLNYVADVKWRTHPALSFTRWFEEVSRSMPRRYYTKAAAAGTVADYRVNMVLQSRQATDALIMTEQSAAVDDEVASPSEPVVTPRSNFAETAYFAATLTTDSAGLAALNFTLPERLTSWRFNALAHTSDMAYGRLDTTLVARRELMIEPAMPRFVRCGDRLVLPYTLRSLIASPEKGKISLTITDGESGKLLYKQNQPFAVKAEGTVEGQFEWKAETATSFVEITLIATGTTFSDGERHLLPILPARVVEERTLSLSLDAVGTTSWAIDTLWNKASGVADRELLVETTSAPIWSAVGALPALAEPTGEGATEALTSYYAATMAAHLARRYPALARLSAAGDRTALSALSRHPELRQTLLAETPWVAEAKSERERLAEICRLFDSRTVAAYRATALAHLQKLQNADGSLSWYPGMSGSLYVTLDVASRLSRLSSLVHEAEADRILAKARTWLEAQIAEEVKEMKRLKLTTVSDHHVVYIHLVALADGRFNATTSWLARQAMDSRPSLSMQSQALLAEAFALTGQKADAAAMVQSLTEHLVTSPEMGTYFDTHRAALSRQSYRVPTQCAAISALTAVDARANGRLVEEMQRWLVQSRRTQMWAEPRAACDAVYALMLGVDSMPDHPAPLRYTLSRGRHILAVNAPSEAEATTTLGYTFGRHVDAAVTADRFTIHKADPGLSFAQITSRQTLPLSAARPTASGMQLTCRYERWDGRAWQVLGEGQRVEAGARVRQVFILETNRDYDFVSLTASRGANAQPRRALSGYASWGSVWGYRAVRDASTSFYMEHLSKGTHTFTEEFIIDRPGRYTYGVCRAACEYAPEYHSQTPAFVMGQ